MEDIGGNFTPRPAHGMARKTADILRHLADKGNEPLQMFEKQQNGHAQLHHGREAVGARRRRLQWARLFDAPEKLFLRRRQGQLRGTLLAPSIPEQLGADMVHAVDLRQVPLHFGVALQGLELGVDGLDGIVMRQRVHLPGAAGSDKGSLLGAGLGEGQFRRLYSRHRASLRENGADRHRCSIVTLSGGQMARLPLRYCRLQVGLRLVAGFGVVGRLRAARIVAGHEGVGL